MVFDVGAHKGEKTDLYLQLGAKRVICFEPLSDCVQFLKDRFNGVEMVEIVPYALGSKEGNGKFYVCSKAPSISTFSQSHMGKDSSFASHGYRWDKIVFVKIKTLNEMINNYGIPNFCKIDVEEYEYEVLSGLNKKIPKIISFEFHGKFIDKISKCLELCKRLGYRNFNISLLNTSKFVLGNHTENIDEVIQTVKMANSEFMKKIMDWDIFGDIYAFS